MSNDNKQMEAGWKLVPVEPTEAMMKAAWSHAPFNMDDMTDGDFGQAYKSMLAAAPQPPVVVGVDERAAFEKWMRSEGWGERSFERYNVYDPDDARGYKSRHVTDMWDGWKARAALAATPSEAARYYPCYGVFRQRPDENSGAEYLHYAMNHDKDSLSDGERRVSGYFVPSEAAPAGQSDGGVSLSEQQRTTIRRAMWMAHCSGNRELEQELKALAAQPTKDE